MVRNPHPDSVAPTDEPAGRRADNRAMGLIPSRRAEAAPAPRQDVVQVTVVTSHACHLCEDALAVLEEVSRTGPMEVRTVDMASEEGRAIVRRHRAPMPPVVLVDGELLGWGRLSRGKLRRRLDQRWGR